MSRVLVTGATGFVGRHLCKLLISLGYQVIAVSRSVPRGPFFANCDVREIGDMTSDLDWGPFLDGVDAVVHLAARVHVMKDTETNPLASFRRVNVDATERLLRHEMMRKVKRFVYISTVKVLGEATNDRPFSSTDVPAPVDPYSLSKLEAEIIVEKMGLECGVETVIVRPPLIYGPGVGGNFVRLLRMIDGGMPLPFGSVDNSRSLVGIDNLCDLIRECITNPSASGKKFLVSDNLDVSTPDLIKLIAETMDRQARLLPVPSRLLNFFAELAGRSAEVLRLTGSMQIDISQTMRSLSWQPPVSLADGIRSTVTWYRGRKTNE